MTPEIPQELLVVDLNSLLGLAADDARVLVESHGGQLRIYAIGEVLRMDLRTDRVTVQVEDDRVVSVRAIG